MASLLTRMLSSVLPAALPNTRPRSIWRYNDVSNRIAHPNYKPHLTHRKHQFDFDTYAVRKQHRLRCVDNSKIGREAMAEGKPPKVIHVYSSRKGRRSGGALGKLGDRVLCSVKGEKIQGIIVGMKIAQKPGIPRFDTNNVVLIDPMGNPLGTRIHVPIPNSIRPILKEKTHAKKADYTKLLAIATRFV